MKYQWILFDADETLFHFDAYQGLKLMFSRFNVDFSTQDFDHYQLVNKPLWVDYQDGKISATQLQNTRFEMWAEKLGVAATRLNSEFLVAMADICSLLPGARELVDALSGKVNMGIITNGFTGLQTIRLERTGLKDIFSPLIISEEVGAAKPDVAIFEYAFNLMNNPAKEQILMVGDNLHSDIQGGINAGIDTCWLNMHGAAQDDNISPRYQVSSLAELQKLLLA
ncbi:pyrimidine 5'-nucleotidase [Yersinia aleksiciae]|uniref:Nucleotidase n=1 Tax=Yersinia aleksiciae TaxID=263819 RepID=A0A0T9T7E0_YERAE|nr:pyrimidine 5'-nucleotidase [Yersinia aleksiciae]MDA5498293.1 pyrimidine 5'-nucleotidase [Yersinia aleksiciae]NIK99221.1 pyrimidine 5'-nucleotidase [Yersinia aleksiciae]WQC72604.1 pyrimidine 5'-nucleotidase [Yersinia aleksiciae]CFQ45453.1 nucleotidase [Yersinia aleksiciae]CNK65922.1 nucleotidase [Yersinia aleksiciae]